MNILVIFNEIFIKIVHSRLFYEGANNTGSYEIILKLYINSDRVKLNFKIDNSFKKIWKVHENFCLQTHYFFYTFE